jgi:hypothetical protein
MKKALWILPIVVAISGCATPPVRVQTEYVPTYVNVPSNCPVKAVAEQLIASRPVPLRSQPRPSDASVRSALSQAQLGMYEAEGGWADKVLAALGSCQTR